MRSEARVDSTGLPADAVSTTSSTLLSDGWVLHRTRPGEISSPSGLPRDGGTPLGDRDDVVPGTVATALGPAGISDHPDYDDYDWWYVRELPSIDRRDARARLRFDGLATLAEVWLDDQRVLVSDNMFTGYLVDITDRPGSSERLALCFRSLSEALAKRRPRPRWRTDLVAHQNLRWFRATLLGRIPGWTPRVQPVGPWRPVWLQRSQVLELESMELRTSAEGADGRVTLSAAFDGLSPNLEIHSSSLSVAGHQFPLEVRSAGSGAWSIDGDLTVPTPGLWWPRTHGEPTLHECRLQVETSDGPCTVELGAIGFRSVELDTTDGRVSLRVNETPIFCRGVCWTTDDIRSLHGSIDRMEETLRLLADANANMVRVGGTMVYERDAFYDTCDRLGLLVWQDFMFANMDYPFDDPDFSSSVRNEAAHQLRRMVRHPSVVAFCGGSEVEQQAAMFGAPRSSWQSDFFSAELPDLVSRLAGDVPYWTSTPTGGPLPFHTTEGLTHYYGVGAYRRPLDDVRLAGVRFTPECLGFSNTPEPSNTRSLGNGRVARHDPSWKAGVPRDSGAGWDFEDIRDHYLEELYGVDAVALRSSDPALYDRLSRVVTGRVMDHVFQEWRASDCGGALVWFAKDLRPGAGWGIIDSENRPKPVYFYLKRAWAPVAVTILDRGLNGVLIVTHNETADPVDGVAEVSLVRDGSIVVGRASAPLAVPPRSSVTLVGDDLFEHFTDSTYSYRFGPRAHDAIVCTFTSPTLPGPITRTHWLDLSSEPPSVDLEVSDGVGAYAWSIRAAGLARDVRVDVAGWSPSDNYFDLAPDTPHPLSLTANDGEERGRAAYVQAGTGETVIDLRDKAPSGEAQR